MAPKGKKVKRSAAASAAAKAAADRADSGMFSRFGTYVDALYDPEAARDDLKLAPSAEPHPGAARAVPFDIDYTSTADDEILVAKMYPRLENTIVVNKSGTVPAPSVENSVFFDFEDTLPAQTTVGMVGRPVLVYGGTTTPDFELPFESAPVTTSGFQNLACGFSIGAAAAIQIQVVNRGDFGMKVYLYQRDTVTGVWSAATQREVTARATATGSLTASANGSNGFAIAVVNASDSVRSLKLRVMFNLPLTGSARVSVTYPASTSKAFSALTTSQAIDEYRTVAMNLRLTCMGDLTTTGGRVACALVPREFVPDPSDPVGSVAKLPIGAYDGKLIDGGDVIWQPRRKDDYDFQPPEWDYGSYYLILVARLAKQNTSVRIKASYNYEIFSLDPNLGGMAYCPSAFGLQEVLRLVFASVSAASGNDGHELKASKAAAVFSEMIKKPITWIRAHPEEALAFAKKAAKAVAKVAVAALL